MFNKLSMKDLDLKDKRVFVRLDLNVPMKEGQIVDDTRIRESLPTIRYIVEKGAIAILASHLGRPKGEKKAEFSLKPVAERLSQMLAKPIRFLSDCVGEAVSTEVRSGKGGDVFLLENLRFYKEEEKNDEHFSKQLADLAERYVNDAFGASHRAHASIVGITRFIPLRAAGFLLQKEIDHLGNLLSDPERPVTALIGGAKISDKIEVVSNLLNIVDNLLIGGGMAYTFFKSRGQAIGQSICEDDKLGLARELMQQAAEKKVNLMLPADNLASKSVQAPVDTKVVKEIPDEWMGVDIGPQTISAYKEIIKRSRTIFWNGPMGVFEVEAFAQGTTQIAQSITQSNATSIVGGGDSIAALQKIGVIDKITHVSTGGGASLEFLAGKRLPGIEALSDK